jgi:hypothetical protein
MQLGWFKIKIPLNIIVGIVCALLILGSAIVQMVTVVPKHIVSMANESSKKYATLHSIASTYNNFDLLKADILVLQKWQCIDYFKLDVQPYPVIASSIDEVYTTDKVLDQIQYELYPNMQDVRKTWLTKTWQNGTLTFGRVFADGVYSRIIDENLTSFFTTSGALIFGLVLFIWLSMAHIRRLVRAIGSGTASTSRGLSAESQELFDVMHAHRARVQGLKKLVDETKRKLTDSVAMNLKQDVYDIVLARIDVNHSTAHLNALSVEKFKTSQHGALYQFHWNVRKIIRRYQGLLHETAGDEAIIFIKPGYPDALQRMLAITRDLLNSASDITLKVSIEVGKMGVSQFPDQTPFMTGLNTDNPFLVSARVLKNISDKTKHTVLVRAANPEMLSELCQLEPRIVNINGESHTRYEVINFSEVKAGTYARSDHAIEAALLDPKQDITFLNDFDKIAEDTATWTDIWQKACSQFPGDDKRLATLLSTAPKIAPTPNVDTIIFMKNFLKHSDSRVRANAIYALTEWGHAFTASDIKRAKSSREWAMICQNLALYGDAKKAQQAVAQALKASKKDTAKYKSALWTAKQVQLALNLRGLPLTEWKAFALDASIADAA